MMLTAERTAHERTSQPQEPLAGTAIVRQVDAATRRLRVSLHDAAAGELWVHSALPTAVELQPGDEVLVTTARDGNHYAIGCLAAPRPPRLELARGRAATVGRDGRLRVCGADGELLLELDPDGDRLRVVARTGSLELDAPSGDLSLRSGGQVRIDGSEVHIAARSRASVAVRGDGTARSSLALEADRAGLHAGEVAVTAARGEFHVLDTRYVGDHFTAALHGVRVVAHRLETVAETVIQRARNVYRTVAELAQLSAGRVRVLVEGTLLQRSRRADLKAALDFKVDGDRIHLG